MPFLNYSAANFDPPPTPNAATGNHGINFTWAEVVWAAMTVGRRQRADVQQHGVYSFWECFYRAFIVFANLKEDAATGRFAKTDAFSALDPSEKGAISYYLGLLAAKLLGDVCINVAWLMHLKVYEDLLHPLHFQYASRPDLVGRNHAGEWNVVEAKGSSNRIRQGVVDRAKNQAGALDLIQDEQPVLNVGSAAGFVTDQLYVRFEDPKKPPGRRKVVLNVSDDDFINEYYAHLQALLNSYQPMEAEIAGRPVLLVDLRVLGLEIGLDAEIFGALKRKRDRFRTIQKTLLPHWQSRSEEFENRRRPKVVDSGPIEKPPTAAMGPDGVAVRLGLEWDSELMKSELADRARNGLRR